ncbi:serine hydrolase domain-containing protein [Streptomyces bohaiensis]|uniref:Beta-lactamase family protein n=1 Tax=Streptomyces bohaiensis TaxID=1431344 RepID=A0ABX1CB81_9ACTN|nr:serine hydrolase domain-containing protein [Streptomyces bohaiensis]NJQ16379.1 beta-lactamase family protein [Streptomyces bohaiensis]
MTTRATGGADVVSLLESAVAVADAPDVVVGWSRHGERVIRSGGTAAPPPLPREHLRYEVGSATKPYTTLLLSALVADGTLTWCTPAAPLLNGGSPRYGPGAAGRPAAGVLHLATHTAGLPRLPADFYPRALPRWTTNPYADYPAERVVDAFLRPARRRREPGSRWRYSNFGASVLGHALAARKGTSWERLLRERVLTPLGLDDTTTDPAGAVGPPPRPALASVRAGSVRPGSGPTRPTVVVGGAGRDADGASRQRGGGDGLPDAAQRSGPPSRHIGAGPQAGGEGGRDAVGHGRDGVTPVPPLLMGGFAPAGAVRATPHDLLTFLEAQLEPERTPLEAELRALRGPVLRRGRGHRHTHTVSWFHRPGERGAVLFHAGATSGQQALLAFRPATGTAMVALSTRRFRATDPFPRVVHALIDDLP